MAQIQKQIDPILSKCGLSYNWQQSQGDGGITMSCVVSHVDGHTETNTLTAVFDESGGKNKIQSVGSTVSYLKRYTLEGALGLSSDYDDDGKGADKKADKKLPVLNPKSDKWKGAVKALVDSSCTIQDIEKKYSLTAANRKKLLDEAV